MAVWLGVLLVLAAGVILGWSLQRLPDAPQCPRCREVTADSPLSARFDPFRAFAWATPPRLCTACGWSGRMRWRPALGRAATRR